MRFSSQRSRRIVITNNICTNETVRKFKAWGSELFSKFKKIKVTEFKVYCYSGIINYFRMVNGTHIHKTIKKNIINDYGRSWLEKAMDVSMLSNQTHSDRVFRYRYNCPSYMLATRLTDISPTFFFKKRLF